MQSDEKVQLGATAVAQNDKQSGYDASLLIKQTRVRRLFTQPQLFAFSASYFIIWSAVGGSMYYALLNGGPAAFLFNYIVVLVGALAQAASFAELASIQPVAGAQYYWTYVSEQKEATKLSPA